MEIKYEIGTIGYLDLTFGPKWDYIPLARNYIQNFLLVNKKDASKVAMSASELLENAVKYSNKDGIRVILRKEKETPMIELHVLNYATKEGAEKVMQYIKEMQEKDPLLFYIEKMKESVGHKGPGAGLGLARICAEAKAIITAEYDHKLGILGIKTLFNNQ